MKARNYDILIGIISLRFSPEGLNDDQVQERREKVSCTIYFHLIMLIQLINVTAKSSTQIRTQIVRID
jgi:hypothetical protein